MHKLLKRQLKKLNINPNNSNITSDTYKSLLEVVSKTYHESDNDRYILERSLEISSQEMITLYKKQKESYDSRLKAIMDVMPDILFLNDEDGKFLEVFADNTKNLYVPKEELLGCYYKDIFNCDISIFFEKNLKKAIEQEKLNIIEYELEIDNKMKSFEARIMPTNFLVNGKKTAMVIIRDTTESKKAERRLKYFATHDNLTKLPNRFLFQKNLKFAMKKATADNTIVLLLFLDIDRFKEINDNLGHDMGDRLLIEVTKRLKTVLCSNSTLARFGGDEFAIIVESLFISKEILSFAEKITAQFNEPFIVKDNILDITISMGASIFPNDAKSRKQLIKQTDLAMYHAKNLGRDNFQFFTKELANRAYQNFMLETKLRDAVRNREFSLLYQPQLRLSDFKIVGLEALIRWESSELGLTSPNIFIPLAEKCGYIESITDWVIENVCQQINAWDDGGYSDFKVSINLSRKDLGKSNMSKRVSNIVKEGGVAFRRVEFEVTESALLENRLNAFKNIERLRSMGFCVSIDDFGTGYSSLSNLKDMFFDKLKIDRSFIKEIAINRGDEAIVKATLALAQSLNLRVVAEGVETEEQLGFLLMHGCDEIQGYIYSPPVEAKEIINLLKWSA